MNYKGRDTCRIDGGALEEVLNFGNLYPSNFVDKNNLRAKVPLVLCRSVTSGLVQLRHTIDRDTLYRNYWYRSDLNPSMINSLRDIVTSLQHEINLHDSDIVVDIGASDGTLLSMFPKHVTTVGFDPANNLKDIASTRCTHFINDYFSKEKYPLKKKAQVITSIAMFYGLENPNSFVKDIKKILAPNGIWVIQLMDLRSMLQATDFMNICHEHLEYYSLEVLVNLMERHGLQVFDVSYNSTNGRSMRVLVGHKDFRLIGRSVFEAIQSEHDYMDFFENPWSAFAYRVEFIKSNIMKFIHDELGKGKSIYVLGASTKGSTLLQYFGIDHNLIPFAAEVNKNKFGLKIVGTGIEIISEEHALKLNPDYFLVLPYHFKEFLLKKEGVVNYLQNGGSLIFPMPCPEIITKEGQRCL